MNPPRTSELLSLAALLCFVVGSLLVGAIAGFATAANVPTWYAALQRPIYAPPNWVFGPVWTTLYVMIGLAGWRIWRLEPRELPGRRGALALWALQLALNFAWSFVFFAFHWTGLALAEILLLFAVIALLTSRVWALDRFAFSLFVPYGLWVGFASVLNFGFWWLNG